MVFYLPNKPHGTILRFTHFTTLVVLCLIVLTSSPFVKADEDPQACEITNTTTNKYFNLSPLTRTKGEDWFVIGYKIDWTFRINICKSVLYEDESLSFINEVSVYGKNKDNNSYSLGKNETNLYFNGDKLVMEFEGHGYCSSSSNYYKRSSFISFICDQTVDGQGHPIYVSSFNECAFFFEWRTPAACPTHKGFGGRWGVFFTFFVVALVVYFIGGIVYNRIVHNASGMHQIPNWEFWSNACDFLKDMILIILAQCPVINKPRRSGGRSYRNLPRDDAENVLIEEEFEEH